MTSNAQTKPESYYAMHNDSCWHFTLNYENPKMRSNEGMVVITHLCTPDTCVSSATRHLQGKRYAKRYVKRYGTAPELQSKGASSCTFAVPESAVRDTVYAITYSEYSNGKETEYACDTMAICMPPCPPMSCHRVDAATFIIAASEALGGRRRALVLNKRVSAFTVIMRERAVTCASSSS